MLLAGSASNQRRRVAGYHEVCFPHRHRNDLVAVHGASEHGVDGGHGDRRVGVADRVGVRHGSGRIHQLRCGSEQRDGGNENLDHQVRLHPQCFTIAGRVLLTSIRFASATIER